MPEDATTEQAKADSPATGQDGDSESAGGAAQTKPAEPTDDLVTSEHTRRIGGRSLTYTATAGRIVLREEVIEDGAHQGLRAKAEVFVVSYVAAPGSRGRPAEANRRPVVFAFNGGPGSSSIWLHMGLLGPRRVLMGDAGDLLPPPYDLADNSESLLAHADLVFIDPVSTGFSRAVKGGKPAEFHAFGRDLETVAEVIRLWTTRNDRWMSPKYLAGESYGTLRAAGLAKLLQERYGMYLNGLMLISTVLDMGTIRFVADRDLPYVLYLPTYAAIAHFHGRIPGRSLAEVVADAEEFARNDYRLALDAGARLDDATRDRVVARLSSLTGLREEYLRQVRLRIEHIRFFKELLRDSGRTVGRIDGRFLGWDADDGGEHWEYDPSISAITGPYAAALNHYVRGELGYASDLPYEVLTEKVQPWSYKEFEGRSVSTTSDLSTAMRTNPHLRVHVACGYYDGATPHLAAEHTFAQLTIPDALRGNVEFAYYPSGHMTYLHEPTRLQQAADLAAFVTR